MLGEVSCCIRTLPNSKETEQEVSMTLFYYLNILISLIPSSMVHVLEPSAFPFPVWILVVDNTFDVLLRHI